MKIAVSSYSFSQAMRDGRMTIMDVIPKAKEMGYEGVEIVRGGWSDEEMRAMAPKLKAQSEEYGMPIIAYMVGADFIRNGLDAEVGRLKREAEVAALLGAPRMRHDSTGGRDANDNPVSVEEALPIVAEGYRRVTEFAAGLGVHTMIENHGYFFQDACRVKKLIETVNHPNFGWLMDMGNFMCADENSAIALGNALPYAAHVHAKDFLFKSGDGENPGEGFFGTRAGNYLRGAIIGQGVVPVKQCLRLLKRANYDGWISLEFEGMEDCITGCRVGLDNLRRMCSEVGL